MKRRHARLDVGNGSRTVHSESSAAKFGGHPTTSALPAAGNRSVSGMRLGGPIPIAILMPLSSGGGKLFEMGCDTYSLSLQSFMCSYLATSSTSNHNYSNSKRVRMAPMISSSRCSPIGHRLRPCGPQQSRPTSPWCLQVRLHAIHSRRALYGKRRLGHTRARIRPVVASPPMPTTRRSSSRSLSMRSRVPIHTQRTRQFSIKASTPHSHRTLCIEYLLTRV